MIENKVADAARTIRDEQGSPRDPEKEDDEQYLARLEREDSWIAGITYKGSSVGWTHSKAENYRRELLKVWEELAKIGVRSDGDTSAAEAIAKFCIKRDPP